MGHQSALSKGAEAARQASRRCLQLRDDPWQFAAAQIVIGLKSVLEAKTPAGRQGREGRDCCFTKLNVPGFILINHQRRFYCSFFL